MTTIKHATLLVLIPTLLITLTALSMEKNYPQLQLQTKGALPTICAELSIKKNNPVVLRAHLATERERKKINETIGVLSSINTPFIPVTVSVKRTVNNNTTVYPWSNWPIPVENKNESITRFPSSIPAELLWNLSTGSTLDLTVHGHPVKLTCCKNTAINNKEFHEQYNMLMENFYNGAYSSIGRCQKSKLISAGVLVEIITNQDEINNNENVMPFYSYAWGPNGCSNEKILIQSIIDEKMATNKNIIKPLIHRQINSSFPKK